MDQNAEGIQQGLQPSSATSADQSFAVSARALSATSARPQGWKDRADSTKYQAQNAAILLSEPIGQGHPPKPATPPHRLPSSRWAADTDHVPWAVSSRLLSTPTAIRRPDKRPPSRPPAVVEPVSSRSTPCDTTSSLTSIGAGGVIFMTPLVFHAIDFSASEVGSGLAISALIGTVVRLLSGSLLDRGLSCSWPSGHHDSCPGGSHSVSSHELPQLPCGSTAARHGCRALLASD